MQVPNIWQIISLWKGDRNNQTLAFSHKKRNKPRICHLSCPVPGKDPACGFLGIRALSTFCMQRDDPWMWANEKLSCRFFSPGTCPQSHQKAAPKHPVQQGAVEVAVAWASHMGVPTAPGSSLGWCFPPAHVQLAGASTAPLTAVTC